MMKRCTDACWFAIALFVLGAGCGFEAGPSSFDDQTIDDEKTNQNEPPATELGVGSGAGTMDGTWLMVHVASSCILGQEQVSAAYLLVDIETDGASLIEHRRHCHLDASEILGGRPVASSETLASVQYPVVDRGIVSGLAPGSGYASSTSVGLWGVELEAPLTEPFPTDPDDDRVIDADGDGNPGVTMHLEGIGCDRYMGQRQISNFYGFLEAPNDIRGTSVRRNETYVYGGSAGTCEMAPDMRSNDEHNFFRMVRVDGRGGAVDATGDDGQIRCDDVAHFFDDLWDVREPDDERCQ